MPRPRVSSQMTTTEVGRELGMKIGRLVSWVEHGVLPQPSFVDNNGVRYFSKEWLEEAREIATSKRVAVS